MHKFSPGTRERVSSQKLQVFSRTHVLYCMLIRRDPHTRDFPAKIPHVGPPPTPDDGWRARVRSGTLPRGHSRLPTGTHSIAFACARFQSHALFASSHRRRRRRAHGRLRTIIRARSWRSRDVIRDRHRRGIFAAPIAAVGREMCAMRGGIYDWREKARIAAHRREGARAVAR